MESLSFDPGLMIWTLVTFGGLMFVLARFAFRPLGDLLKQREETIKSSLDRAEKLKQEASELMSRNEEQLGHAREEARKIISEGQRIVADMKKEAEERARKEADLILDRARSDADREFSESLDELRGVVANLSVRISRQVIREELDEEKHKRLADDLIDRLRKSNVGKQR